MSPSHELSDSALERTPATGTPRGTVVVLGGRGESAEVYTRFADRIAVDGYRVVALPDVSATESSFIAVARRVFDENTAGPRLLVASDAAVAHGLRAVTEGDLVVDGVVVAGTLTLTGTVELSSADDEIAERTSCPVHRVRLAGEGVLAAGALTRSTPRDEVDGELAARIPVPVLALHGDHDGISRLEPAIDVLGGIRDARIFVLEGGKHDVLNDVTHRSVAAEIVQFLERLRTPEQGLKRVLLVDSSLALG